MEKSKEDWRKDVLAYLEKNKSKNVSIFELGNINGFLYKNLKEAVEELESEDKITVELDAEGKKWLKHKE